MSKPYTHPAQASATGLALAPSATVILLPARVPLEAPTIPATIVQPWERVVPGALVLVMAVVWFFSVAPTP